MKKVFSFLKEKLTTAEPTECIAMLFCIAISISLLVAFIFGIFAILLGRTETTIATHITILQTTIAIIAFGGAIVAFIGWKELKNTAGKTAEETASKTAEEAVKKYFLENAPEQRPDDETKQTKTKQKDDIETIKT